MTWEPPAIWLAITEERLRQTAKWDDSHAWGRGDCSSGDVATPVKLAVRRSGDAAVSVLRASWARIVD